MGIAKATNDYERVERNFYEAATIPGKEWYSVRKWDNENSIQAAFHHDIVQEEQFPAPSEVIILDVVKAVAHRK
jgi:hypothetical protein